MRVYSHFAVTTLSNTYLIGLPSRRAILVDPSVFDAELLDLIEHHGYTVTCILLTHADDEHLSGLRSIMRVYSGVRICAAVPKVREYAAMPVANGESVQVCDSTVEVIGLPGQGHDRIAFLIGGFLFSGPALSAGEYGAVSNPYAKAILQRNVAESILTLPGETVILPFYGPPTTVEVARQTLPAADPTELAGFV